MTHENLTYLLIVICGWPLSGKGTVARGVSEALGIRHLDIDENIRRPVFGLPHPHPETSPAIMQQDVQEMLASYKLLLLAADCFLEQRRPLILTATFSRCIYLEMLTRMMSKHPESRLKIVWCHPTNDSTDEVGRRLETRRHENSASSVNSIERYVEVKSRFEPIQWPHVRIETSPPASEKHSVHEALRYIVGDLFAIDRR
jgi:predicted kinase